MTHWNAPAEGLGRTIVIGGEAGIGKTRLVTALEAPRATGTSPS
jgi:predicted ATP-dependent serine protease